VEFSDAEHRIHKGYSNDTFQIVTGGWDEDTTSPVSLWSFKLPLHNEDDEYGMMTEDDEYDLQVSESVEVAGSVMDMAVYQSKMNRQPYLHTV